MNDTFELITRPVGVRLIEAEKLTNNEMETGWPLISYNYIEHEALRICHFLERTEEEVMSAWLDILFIEGTSDIKDPKGFTNSIP